MKKIVAIAITVVLMMSAVFALDFEAGVHGILGRNLDGGSFEDNYKAAKQDMTFDYGFGAYANFALFGGLGIQAEANYITSSINFVKDGAQSVQYNMHILDLSPMVWLNLDLWRITVGFGAGPDFEIPLASLGDISNAKKQDFTVGVITGADVKYYFTDHLGLVLSGRFICDWQKKDVPIEVNGYQLADSSYPSYSFSRRTLYGGLGLEFKLF